MKEQFSKFEKSEKLNPNGRCKLHDYILLMSQEGKIKYYIPIDWNHDNRWIIAFDYNEKEQ